MNSKNTLTKEPDNLSKKKLTLNIFYNLRIPILIVIVIVLFSILSDGFLTLRTLNSILSLMSAYGIIAIGQTLVILIGGLDVSVGGIMAISGLIMIKLMPYGTFIAISASLGSGIIIGLVNGLIITRFRVNSLITTIGMGFLLGGIAYLISDGTIHLKDHPIVNLVTEFYGKYHL